MAIEIPLTKSYTALCDAADYEALAEFRWYPRYSHSSGPYAIRSVRLPDGRWTTESMHRHLFPDASEVDHINGDGLDNRRSNLRPATRAENQRNRSGLSMNNTSGYRGVTWRKDHRKWHARIGGNGRQTHLGFFDTAEAAARAFDRAAVERYGGFAGYLNFPDEVSAA